MVWPIMRKQSRNLRLRRPSSQRRELLISTQTRRATSYWPPQMLLSKLTRCPWEVIVFRAAALSLFLILVLVSFARSTRGQENESQPTSQPQSLGDIAREARAT